MINNEPNVEIINSGQGVFKNKFEYCFIKTYFYIDGLKKFTSSYFLFARNLTYLIQINSIKEKNIEDVILEIYEYE